MDSIDEIPVDSKMSRSYTPSGDIFGSFTQNIDGKLYDCSFILNRIHDDLMRRKFSITVKECGRNRRLLFNSRDMTTKADPSLFLNFDDLLIENSIIRNEIIRLIKNEVNYIEGKI